MANNIGGSHDDSKARLIAVNRKLLPRLEDRLWNEMSELGVIEIFDDAAKFVEKRLKRKLDKERVILTQITEAYAGKYDEALAVINKVGLQYFDGGHVFLIGVGLNYGFSRDEKNKVVPIIQFEMYNDGLIKMPFDELRLPVFWSDRVAMRFLKEKVNSSIEKIIAKFAPPNTTSSQSYNTETDDPDWEMERRRKAEEERQWEMDMRRWDDEHKNGEYP
jgi:hypothetical protein